MSRQHHRKQLTKAKQRREQERMQRERRQRVVVVVVVAALVLGLTGGVLAMLTGGADDTPAIDDTRADDGSATPDDSDAPADASADADADATGDDEAVAAAGQCPEPVDAPTVDAQVYDEPPAMSIDTEATYVATFVTSCGDIEIRLDPELAPIATNNLVNLAEDGYYDGVVFHRVIDGFVIQAGDPAGTGCGQEDCTAEGYDPDAPTYPGYTFEDELERAEQLFAQVGMGYPRGVLAMANAGPDTNGSQFYITHGEPTMLPGPDYTVFGEVTSGIEVVDAIAASPTDDMDRPLVDVVIMEVQIETS